MNDSVTPHFEALLEQVRVLAARGDLPAALALIERTAATLRAPRDRLLLLKLDIAAAAQDVAAVAAAEQELDAVGRESPANAARIVASLRSRRRADAAWNLLAALPGSPALAPEAFLLGVEFARAGDAQRARVAYEYALAANPDLVEARINFGDILLARRDFLDARPHFERAVELRPESGAAWLGLAQSLLNLGEGAPALAAFARLPGGLVPSALLDAWRATAHAQAGDDVAAAALYERAIAADSVGFAGLFGYALLVERRGDLESAARLYARALAAAPQSNWALANQVYCLQRIADWDTLRAPLAELLARLRSGDVGDYANSTWIGFGLAGALQRDVAAKFSRIQAGLRVTAVARRAFAPNDGARLRIGYVGSDFRGHATSYLLVGVLEHHARARFEVFAYALAPTDDAPVARRIVAACEHFVDVAGLPAERVAARILADRIDILVDLNGHTKGECMGLVALRPAPIIVNYLGFPGTMGAFVDYIIADRLVIPQAAAGEFSEAVVRLPGCYQPNDALREIGAPTTRAEHGLSADAIVACSFNQSWKFTPAIWAIWMRQMAAHPRLLLWLLEDNPWASSNLRRHAQAAGVSAERIVFAPRVPHAAHLARLALADLAFDTLPCNSHTTGSDALCMGVPLVTIAGDAFAARVGASLLHAVGLAELVTDGEDDYAALLDALLRTPGKLAALKARLLAARATAPLFDTATTTRALESAFAAMYARFRAGRAPAAIDLSDAAAGA
ncbi:MAG: tetratricopeptide repeat protein [Rudaea sp.]